MLAPFRKRKDLLLASDIRVVGPEDVPASWNTALTGGSSSYPTPYEYVKSAGGSYDAKINVADVLFSGRWYFELELINPSSTAFLYFSTKTMASGFYVRYFGTAAGQPQTGGTAFRVTDFDPWVAGDIIMLAVDIDTGFIWTGKNGVWDGGADPGTLTNPTSGMLAVDGVGIRFRVSGVSHLKLFAGQEPMNYDVPFGFCPGWYVDN